ncbi:hypothetical protein TB2_027116 [Malus domestica]
MKGIFVIRQTKKQILVSQYNSIGPRSQAHSNCRSLFKSATIPDPPQFPYSSDLSILSLSLTLRGSCRCIPFAAADLQRFLLDIKIHADEPLRTTAIGILLHL